jgi:DNA-binding response OmpR family regulator
MKALLVSGNPGARAWMRGALGAGWTIAEAEDGHAALRAEREEGYDIVITDDETEPFGAFGLARELKILEEPPAVIVLLQRSQDVWLASWSGADRWLVQPVDAFALADAATELVGAPATT